ncbi:epoxide hydrolase [Nocardioides baekrokdamisoli]|uniref:Epoxide hydrolase n=1 Tax=Nocardioides baekrokdamisoli TaxID=1804624 RepID=A0A3G9IUL5_9ACTN|nr:alpha/beta hydrolase [Nocardioides baekrokdamisoli]BBH15893.1 epoxide hydrolase [Nocardioides baekrokdamisoli]
MLTTFDDWIAGGDRIVLGDHEIFVRQDGPAGGSPVTLIHGFPTSSHDWSAIVPALVEAGMRVTTLDLLGFGASDKPRGYDYSLLEQSDLVEAMWTALDIGDTALVAHDYGVSVAQELLARNPARVTRMVWLNGGLYPDLHRPIATQRLLHSPLGRLMAPVISERTFTAAMHQIMGRVPARADLHEMWRSIAYDNGKAVQHRVLRYIDERRTYAARWRQSLESYEGPSLFIWGPADPISGRHVIPRLRERMPNATIVDLDDGPATGHYPQVENPGAVIAALLPFLTADSQ